MINPWGSAPFQSKRTVASLLKNLERSRSAAYPTSLPIRLICPFVIHGLQVTILRWVQIGGLWRLGTIFTEILGFRCNKNGTTPHNRSDYKSLFLVCCTIQYSSSAVIWTGSILSSILFEPSSKSQGAVPYKSHRLLYGHPADKAFNIHSSSNAFVGWSVPWGCSSPEFDRSLINRKLFGLLDS
jgi:hypothetical protein